MSETFIKTLSPPHPEFSGQNSRKSALQQSLFRRYSNFAKIMRTIHASMTSTL